MRYARTCGSRVEGCWRWRTRGRTRIRASFFLSFAKLPHLDGKVTIFGRVIDGHGTLDALERLAVDERDRPVRDAKIERVTIHANPLA